MSLWRETEGAHLTVPSISEEKEMGAVEENVERQPPRMEKLPLKPVLAHRVYEA